jgi:hypothetical protein
VKQPFWDDVPEHGQEISEMARLVAIEMRGSGWDGLLLTVSRQDGIFTIS